MSAHDPDDTAVSMEHIDKFLAWYGARVKLDQFGGNKQMWWNALNNLTVGELRTGIRAYQRFSSSLPLTPPQFWQLCKGQTDERRIAEFKKLRETIRKSGPMRIATQYVPPKRKGNEADKPGASHD